jgi:hypothetical protein
MNPYKFVNNSQICGFDFELRHQSFMNPCKQRCHLKKNVEHVTFSQLKEGKSYKCTIKCKLSIEDQNHDGYKPWHQHQRFWPWKIA